MASTFGKKASGGGLKRKFAKFMIGAALVTSGYHFLLPNSVQDYTAGVVEKTTHFNKFARLFDAERPFWQHEETSPPDFLKAVPAAPPAAPAVTIPPKVAGQ
jgi:hypothetical protein